jgi:hypothetical protein
VEIETAVLARVHKALQEPEMIIGVWQAAMKLRERKEMDEPTVLVVMRQMSEIWEHLFPIGQNRIMRFPLMGSNYMRSVWTSSGRTTAGNVSAVNWNGTNLWPNNVSTG